MPFGGVGGGDGAEVSIGYSVVRRAVADDVEGVEEVTAEVQTLLPPDGEGLRHRQIDLFKARSTERHGTHIAERVVRLLTEDAAAGVLCRTACSAGVTGQHIGSEPGIHRAVLHLERVVLVWPGIRCEHLA